MDFPVLLTSLRTLSIASRCQTLLAAGRRKVAVVEIVVLGTLRPGEGHSEQSTHSTKFFIIDINSQKCCWSLVFPRLSSLHRLPTLSWAGEVAGGICELAAVQTEAGVAEGFLL